MQGLRTKNKGIHLREKKEKKEGEVEIERSEGRKWVRDTTQRKRRR